MTKAEGSKAERRGRLDRYSKEKAEGSTGLAVA
jgi:hypothetical protein